MNEFCFYFSLGWQHMLRLDATDHLLFMMALTATYINQSKRKLIFSLTAFTLGHLITLYLSAYNLIRLNSNWVEFFIPVTIVITSLANLIYKKTSYNYVLALLFGLIHGMGFANTIRMMLGKHERIALPLASFHVGLELAQIGYIFLLLLVSYICSKFLKISPKLWGYLLSILALIGGLYMCYQRWPQ